MNIDKMSVFNIMKTYEADLTLGFPNNLFSYMKSPVKLPFLCSLLGISLSTHKL